MTNKHVMFTPWGLVTSHGVIDFNQEWFNSLWLVQPLTINLIQYSLVVNWTPRNKHQWNLNWGRVTHIGFSNYASIGSDNGLSPGTNVGILSIGPLGTNFSEILIEIHIFSFTTMQLKMSSENGGHFVFTNVWRRLKRGWDMEGLFYITVHNGRDSVSNHQSHNCLLNRLFRRRSKKTSKLRVTGLCAGKSPGTGEFPAQMASNAENVSIWWRHHDLNSSLCFTEVITVLYVISWCHIISRYNGTHCLFKYIV